MHEIDCRNENELFVGELDELARAEADTEASLALNSQLPTSNSQPPDSNIWELGVGVDRVCFRK